MAETFRVLDTTRIQFSGSGMDDYWATRPAFLTVHGLRVGVLSYCNRTAAKIFCRPFSRRAITSSDSPCSTKPRWTRRFRR